MLSAGGTEFWWAIAEDPSSERIRATETSSFFTDSLLGQILIEPIPLCASRIPAAVKTAKDPGL
jgi:hypothetical protein